MRVCVFSIVNYWHGVKGGMEIHGKLLGEGLVKRGHDVSIITTRHHEPKEFEKIAGIKIYYLKNTVFGSRRKNWKTESVTKFLELHQEQPFDIVWSQSFAAYGLARFNTNNLVTPVVPILQGCIRQEIKSFLNNIFFKSGKSCRTILKSFIGLLFSYYAVQRPLLSISDRVVAVSRELIEDLKRWYGDDIANKSVAVFNGIDTKHFRPNSESRKSVRDQYGIEDHEILLLSLGTISKEKGHHVAVKALSHLKQQIPEVRLMIVGTGEYQTILEKEIMNLGLQNHVILAGFVDNRQTAMFYNAADVYLMPTLRVEGLPFVLLEAMSCGKPVVVSRIGGNTSAVTDGDNGLLVEPGNVEQLAEKAQRIIQDAKLAMRLSASARRSILNHFSSDQMIDRTIDLMREVVK